ncbi:hypothetical protein GIB67_030480 [Kingdonia uniflora]|uniref:Plastid lipid-associated protein/fibrillin conserved domain-containing protein n=1 Tax=Kingdonia uniflora TaxID=39325 RepID=A0A7J7P7L6_9MAGN|nr:hypothetical protein GIB67_030480 [Kingdonia uniflora]
MRRHIATLLDIRLGRQRTPSSYLLSDAFHDIFRQQPAVFTAADICQLEMDQRKINVLAREYCDVIKRKNKPIILSHHMLPGLQKGQEKMSKRETTSSIFMEDEEVTHELSGFSNTKLNQARPVFRVRSTEDGEYTPVPEEVSGGRVAPAVPVEAIEPSEIDTLKKVFIDLLYGTDRGLTASSDTRAEIIELITQYTSFVGLFPLLTRGTLPLVKVEEISQTIDSENFTVQNSVQFTGPLATTSLSINAKFEIKFEQGIIGTPQLTDSIVPEDVDFLGQKIDLVPFKGLITSLQDKTSSVVKSISSRPPLKFAITNDRAQSWLLTTYLDEDLRISKGDGGSVFVLIKDGSSLLNLDTLSNP